MTGGSRRNCRGYARFVIQISVIFLQASRIPFLLISNLAGTAC